MALLVRRKVISPVELVEAHLDRIQRVNPTINAFVHVMADEALDAAARAEQAVFSGARLGTLHGIPVAIKDADFKAGVPNTWGSRPLAQYVPDTDALVVKRLEHEGAIVLGKTNMPEFGMGSTTDNLLFGATSTPLAPGFNAGGSSGGSAAAVAAGMAALAQGSDGGGSIRIPAACCGVYGLKGSWGRVPLVQRPDAFLHTPFVSTGPLARTTEDAALMMATIAGPDRRDPFSLPMPLSIDGSIHGDITGLRVGYSRSFGGFHVTPEVSALIDAAAVTFEEAGASVEETEIHFGYSPAEIGECWLRQAGVLNAAVDADFAHRGLRLLDDYRHDLTEPFAQSVELGRHMTALQYKSDDIVRTRIYDEIERVLQSFDLLVTPTTAAPPVPNATHGMTLGPATVNGHDVDRNLGWVLTYPLNETGHPAASIPAGLATGGLPVGMQIIGGHLRDDLVLTASAAFERAQPWYSHYPVTDLNHDSG